jgi:dolichyl-phosphate-mannose-protein mannosyltransferase
LLSSTHADSFDSEYSVDWWTWLFATGFFLACTLGCKMVGLFTFFTIGAAVVVDLWNLLDYKKGLSMVSAVPANFD